MTRDGRSERERRKLRNTVRGFSGKRVLVFGDVMVDRYFWGKVRRISPEAPVPVVEVERETLRLGGAANVAHNIRTLGGEPLLCGLAGHDPEGKWLVSEMGHLGLDPSGIMLFGDFATTVKSRVVAHSQQVVRFDRETSGPPPEGAGEMMAAYLRANWGKVDGVVVSDYGKGVIGEEAMDTVRSLRLRRKRLPVAVDPKTPSFRVYRRMTVITPNFTEALAAAALAGERSTEIEKVGKKLLSASGSEALLITRGEEGMSLFEKKRKSFHIGTEALEVYDVTGAGDTVIGTLSLALAAGASMREAATLANLAAGIVVGEFGTVPARADQLLQRLSGAAAR